MGATLKPREILGSSVPVTCGCHHGVSRALDVTQEEPRGRGQGVWGTQVWSECCGQASCLARFQDASCPPWPPDSPAGAPGQGQRGQRGHGLEGPHLPFQQKCNRAQGTGSHRDSREAQFQVWKRNRVRQTWAASLSTRWVRLARATAICCCDRPQRASALTGSGPGPESTPSHVPPGTASGTAPLPLHRRAPPAVGNWEAPPSAPWLLRGRRGGAPSTPAPSGFTAALYRRARQS